MATSRDLTNVMSGLLKVSQSYAESCYRELREHGVVSKAGRGPNASAKMTARDAAVYLVGVLGCPRLSDAPGIVKAFSMTGLVRGAGDTRTNEVPIPEVAALPKGHSYIDMLEALFASGANATLKDAFVRTWLQKPSPVANVEIKCAAGEWSFRYGIDFTAREPDVRKLERYITDLFKELGIDATGDRNTFEEVSTRTFSSVGSVIATRVS